MINLKVKPQGTDFEYMPEIDFTGKLDNPDVYNNTFNELVVGMQNPVFVRNMGQEAVREVFNRAYNYAALMFAGYNRRAYLCMSYAEVVKDRFVEFVHYKAG